MFAKFWCAIGFHDWEVLESENESCCGEIFCREKKVCMVCHAISDDLSSYRQRKKLEQYAAARRSIQAQEIFNQNRGGIIRDHRN